MKYSFLILFLLTSFMFAAGSSNLPEPSYSTHVGLDSKVKVSGDASKKDINRKVKVKELIEVDMQQVDLENAYILQQINSEMSRGTNVKAKDSGNLMALPGSYTKEVENYNKKVSLYNKNQIAINESKQKPISKLLLLECLTLKDYKISSNGRFKMICTSPKNYKKYKVSSMITITKTGEVKLEAKPYLLEDEQGRHYKVDTKNSKLFNATNGSDNLATYIDKREVENIQKEMAKTFAKETPKITKDYLDKKYAPESEVIQNIGNSTVATKTPTPSAGDYGISLLINVLSTGVSAGVEQLYQDLGYIYFIPRHTKVDAEIVFVEKGGNYEK